MSLDSIVSGLVGTNQEIFEQVKARTVTKVGRLSGAELGGVLLSFGVGLVSFVTDKASSTGVYSLIRDICVGLTDRFKPDGEVDFADPANVLFIDAFLADPEVNTLLSAIPPQLVKDSILSKASVSVPEFPGVTLHDIIVVTDPALATQETSEAVTIKGISQVLKLTTANAMPETAKLTAQISHDGVVWQPVATSGLEQVSGAGLYVFRVLPGPVFIADSQIQVVSPYSVGLTLA